MQKLYIAFFNTTFRLTSKLNKATRDAVLLMCCITLVVIYFFGRVSLDPKPHKIMILGTVVTVIMSVFSVKEKVHEIKWNPLIYYPMVLFGIGMIFIRFIHPLGSGYLIFAIDLAFVFPAFYFVWGNRKDYDFWYVMLSIVTLIAGITSAIYILVLARKGELNYVGSRLAGYKSSPNFIAMMGTVMVISGNYMLLHSHKNILINIISTAGICIGVTYAILTMSRTSILAVAVCVVTDIVFVIRRFVAAKDVRNKKKKAAIAILLVIIVGMIGFRVMGGGNSGKYDLEGGGVAATEQSRSENNEVGENKENVKDGLLDRLLPSRNKGKYASGRMQIWGIYMSHANMLGNPPEVIAEELKAANETRAHNNFVDYFFRCGYLDSFFYVIFFFAVGIRSLAYLFDFRARKAVHAYLVMITGSYAVNAMFEIATLPFMRIIPCFFFLTLMPMMVQNNVKGARPVVKE